MYIRLIHVACIAIGILLISQSFGTELKINDLEWPPFFFPEHESEHKGLAKDIINTCSLKNNFNIRYLKVPVKRTHKYMKTGELDIAVYSYTDARTKFVLYGREPIFITEYGFASYYKDNINLKQLKDITPYKFGNLTGLSHTPELMAIIKKKEAMGSVINTYSLNELFNQFLSTPPRFDIIANSKETLNWQIQKLDVKDKIKIHPLTIKEKAYFVTVSKSSQNIEYAKRFLITLDDCIATMKENGQYTTITNEYLRN